MSYPTYDLTINKLVVTNNERCARWHNTPQSEWSALEWAGAMCGEAGEAANAAKKLKRLEVGMMTINEEARHYSTLSDAQMEVAKECADTILYALLLMSRMVSNPEQVIIDVFNWKTVDYGFPERL